MHYYHGIGGVTKKHAVASFVLFCCLALFWCLTIYGIFCYRAGPIRKQSEGVYRDKSGRTFTESQFHAFIVWEVCFFSSFGAVAIAGVAASMAKRAHKTDE